MTTTQPAIDQAKADAFLGGLIGDLGAALSAVLVHLGDRLGLYRAMADGNPVTSGELAERTGLAERYVREWLHNHAAAGWLGYDPVAQTFTLPAEHAQFVADPASPAFMLGGFDFVAAGWADEAKLAHAFRTGEGLGYHEHDVHLFAGVERFFKPGYQANLVGTWLPALDGVVDRLRAGARVADVGCGHGAATILLASAFPASTVVGFDYHDASVAAARDRSAEAGVPNVSFEIATATGFPGRYDLVCLFDCLHDMGDPAAALRHVHDALTADGTLLLVEPAAADRPEGNHHALGRLFYAASTAFCVPTSLSQDGRLGLGNQAGTARLLDLLTEAGFRSPRLATSSPVNVIVEARR
jgi:SAM-dependent methyltransferase